LSLSQDRYRVKVREGIPEFEHLIVTPQKGPTLFCQQINNEFPCPDQQLVLGLVTNKNLYIFLLKARKWETLVAPAAVVRFHLPLTEAIVRPSR